MAFVEPYQDRYDYVPFKVNWYVDCRPKKRLLKNSVVDKQVLENMSTQDLMRIVNARNIDIIEKIIAGRVKEQNAIANHTTIEDMDTKAERDTERLKHVAKKRTMKLMSGLACAPDYKSIYGTI